MTKGLYLYKRKNGYYYVGQVLPDGRTKWTTTKCKDKPSANLFLNKYRPTNTTERVEYTISNYITLYKERMVTDVKPSTMGQYVYAMETLKGVIGDKFISQITVSDLEQFKSIRLSKTKLTSTNILLRGVKTMLSKATTWELIDNNPMRKVQIKKSPVLPPRFLTKEDLDTLNAVVKEEQLKDLFTFAAHTGCRLSEITHLRWHFINEESRFFTVANTWNWKTKSGKSRNVPIDDTVMQILQRQKMRQYMNTTYVFQKKGGYPLTKDYLTHKFAFYRHEAKLSAALHFHSLRHTAISWWLMSGIDAFTAKEFAGHSDTKLIDEVYGHLTDHHRNDSIKKLDAWLTNNQKG